jgi:tRNA(Leu) C34 or U34 (ribose-2'-O)-methylase TrmL
MNPNKAVIKMVGKTVAGVVPSIVLVNPRFSHNVGMVVRLASCYGFRQVWFTGDRVGLDLDRRKRLPREERMKGYRDVEMIQYDRPLEQFPSDVVPVAVEVRKNSERLQDFVHPKNAVYIFGPEDGSIPSPILNRCHRFVIIPTRNHFCLNLATAAATIMWDRVVKLDEVPDHLVDSPSPPTDTNPDEIGVYRTENESWP